MVWFARWRPKWKKLFIGTMIVASLATAVKGVHEYRQYSDSKTAVSQIVQIEETIKNRMHNMEVNIKLLKDAEEYKALAERFVKEGKFAEAGKYYQSALRLFEEVDRVLPSLELNYMKSRLDNMKTSRASRYFNEGTKEVIDVDRSLDDAIKRVEELKRSVSGEIGNIKTQISSLQK